MKKKLRIWWISNPPRKPFTKEVSSIKEAKDVLQVLTDYDLYLDEIIDSNAGGMEVFEDGKWHEWYDDEGNDIFETPLVDKVPL